MNSLLASSLYNHDFIKYRKNNTTTQRNRFSKSVKGEEVPVVVDSIDPKLCIKENGKEYHFYKKLLIEDILLEVKKSIKIEENQVLKVGLDNGKILDNIDIVGDLYLKYKNQDDNILYLFITQETTIYGYIMSLIRYVFGMKV